jgi:hypothetical protein
LQGKEARMGNLLRRNQKDCRAFGEAAEAAAQRRQDILLRQDLLAELEPQLQLHPERCDRCGSDLDSMLTARDALRGLARPEGFDAPWFAARVMAEISAHERVREGQEGIWRAVPRLASRFAGVAMIVLLLAGGWLIRRPAEKPTGVATVESLFDSWQVPATRDDVLAGVLEKGR